MNRWHVYEYLKQRFMVTGTIPSLDVIQSDFNGLIDECELYEGIDEFNLAMGARRGERHERSA